MCPKRWLLVTIPLWGGMACSSTSEAPDAVVADAPSTVGCPDEPGLCLSVTPGDAEIVVDGKALGTVASLGGEGSHFVALAPGIHRITLRREGMGTWRTEVTVGAAAEPIEVELQPK